MPEPEPEPVPAPVITSGPSERPYASGPQRAFVPPSPPQRVFVPPGPAEPAPPASALPIQLRAYHEFYRTPRLRWWKPLVAIVGAAVAMFAVTLVVSLVYGVFALESGELSASQLNSGDLPTTPSSFLANNLALIASIPIALLAHRLVFGQRAGWLASIQGRFRWRLLGRFLLIALPFYLVMYGVQLLADGVGDFSWLSLRDHTIPMIVIIVTTTPLQAAGEEYAMRGLLARCVGSWIPHRAVGFVVSTAASAAVFTLLHGAGDPWLISFYAFFAVVASVLVWRTGGLEASIALHVVNNLVSLAFVPFLDMSGLFNREAGVGSPLDLIQVACVVAVAAVYLWQAKRLGLRTQAAPGFAPERLDPVGGLRWLCERLPSRRGRTLVGVDGVSGSGKTTFANELARLLGQSGVPVIRISLDDFLNPRELRHARGRTSPEGYFLDSHDRARIVSDVLEPLGPGGSGRFRRAAYDLATETPLDAPWETAPDDVVVIVDGLFLLRDEFCPALGQAVWDYSVWMDVPFVEAYRRMAGRGGRPSDLGDPRNARYLGGEALYLHACDPAARADLVVDNSVTFPTADHQSAASPER